MGKKNLPPLIDEKIAAELVGIAFDRHELAALGQQAKVVQKHLGVPCRQHRRAEAKRFVDAALGVKEQGKRKLGGVLPVRGELGRGKADQDNGDFLRIEGGVLVAQLRDMLTARQSA